MQISLWGDLQQLGACLSQAAKVVALHALELFNVVCKSAWLLCWSWKLIEYYIAMPRRQSALYAAGLRGLQV
jgi:hypothetical protein